MASFKIEKNIPIPPAYRGRKRRYPWDEMDIGDSFRVSKKLPSATLSNAHKRTGNKFCLRRDGSGTRVWRIA